MTHVLKLIGMDTTIEQYGPELDFLECRLRYLPDDDFICAKSAMLDPCGVCACPTCNAFILFSAWRNFF